MRKLIGPYLPLHWGTLGLCGRLFCQWMFQGCCWCVTCCFYWHGGRLPLPCCEQARSLLPMQSRGLRGRRLRRDRVSPDHALLTVFVKAVRDIESLGHFCRCNAHPSPAPGNPPLLTGGAGRLDRLGLSGFPFVAPYLRRVGRLLRRRIVRAGCHHPQGQHHH